VARSASCKAGVRPTRARTDSFFPLDPHAHFARLVVERFDMHDARPAAHRAILGVHLSRAAAGIDEQLVDLSAERTGDFGALAPA
jgi:hypothetical protein